MYSDSGSTVVPISTIGVASCLFALASSTVGSSSFRPLTKMMFALLSSSAT